MSVVVVHEGTPATQVMPRADKAEAVVVDNLDRFSEGLRRALFNRRHGWPGGCLVTSSRFNALERELLTEADAYHPMGEWEDRPEDVLLFASVAWDELGRASAFHEACSDDASKVLTKGPWPLGAHSIRRTVGFLAETLDLEGAAERPRLIEPPDVLSAVVSHIREQRRPQLVDTIRIVVEGSTDALYLQSAAQLAIKPWGTDLLSGCEVAPPGGDRAGGAERATRELLSLEIQGRTAVALFDNDEPGRQAARNARKLTSRPVVLLPAAFDPLQSAPGNEAVEIEDLVPLALLEQFYEAHPALEPEERVTRRDMVRIVVDGSDKQLAAEWITGRASFGDMEKFVYVICALRGAIGLPLPEVAPSLNEWIERL